VLNETGKLIFAIDGHQIELISVEIQVVATARPGFVAAEDRGYIVALETTITPELREEGLVRDLTHYVQDMRKRAGFDVEDHIVLYTEGDLAPILHGHKKMDNKKRRRPSRRTTTLNASEPWCTLIF
jgi:isoleucyl-tRNA synthetase